jgi:hypothetical protein
MSEADCSRKGKWIRGCRFKPRYSWRGPSKALCRASDESTKISDWLADRLLEEKIYVQDVCVTCGRTAQSNRAQADSELREMLR